MFDLIKTIKDHYTEYGSKWSVPVHWMCAEHDLEFSRLLEYTHHKAFECDAVSVNKKQILIGYVEATADADEYEQFFGHSRIFLNDGRVLNTPKKEQTMRNAKPPKPNTRKTKIKLTIDYVTEGQMSTITLYRNDFEAALWYDRLTYMIANGIDVDDESNLAYQDSLADALDVIPDEEESDGTEGALDNE